MKLVLVGIALVLGSCSDDELCDYTEGVELMDCQDMQLNFGDACDSNKDGINNGTVNDFCECISDYPIQTSCPGFIQNGDFEIVTGDPNASIDQDIDLATHWKPLWASGSLADLFNDSTTYYGASCFVGPTPTSGVFAGMWIENDPNPAAGVIYREGMFNELSTTIHQNTGIYTLTFDYANMSESCAASEAVKVGIYGVYYPNADPLPANPTGLATPSNLDLFGATNTVFLGEVVVTSTTTNNWTTTTLTIDTSLLTFPTNGINHVMVANSHLQLPDYGKMFLGFDNFCLIN